MKHLAPLVAILGFTAPTTIAGPLDGNGVWCPYLSSESFTNSAFGYWFHANKATSYLIEGYGIQAGEPFYYTEVHDSHIELDVDEWLLDRQTL